ncbi:MAG: di-heme-cytochrome C peroxidase [Pirellulales bacterium]
MHLFRSEVTNMTNYIASVLGVILAVTNATAVEPGAAPVPARTYLDQGWSDEDRDWFYNTTQGSRLVPYHWFLALEQMDSDQLFMEDRHIEQLGFLPGYKSDRNPDRLPIGFAKDEDTVERAFDLKLTQLMLGIEREDIPKIAEAKSRNDNPDRLPLLTILDKPRKPELENFPKEKSWLGLTCAACHTGVIESGEQRIYVDGAPSMAEMTLLLEGIVASLYATLNDENSKFDRFADRVLGSSATLEDRERLRAAVVEYTTGLEGFAERSHPVNPFGYGRLDAFGILLNEIAGTAINVPENWRRPNAPVSYPYLWHTPDLDWVQWNGLAHSTLARNTGEVLGVFADLRLDDLTNIRTSANIRNLFALEERVKTLKPPQWPEAVLGKIDADLVEHGKSLYVQHRCVQCHNLPPYPMVNPPPPPPPLRSVIEIVMTPLQEVGTDPSMAVNIVARTGKTGPFKAALNGAEDIPIGTLFGVAVGTVLTSEFERLQIPPQQRFVMNDRRGSKTPTAEHLASYKARPLSGIWATAPYLHNGSVASLYELLLPPAKRQPKFHVGSRIFDSAKVGYRSDAGGFELNTDLPGNRNSGHYYGTEINDADRKALVEYLKTL